MGKVLKLRWEEQKLGRVSYSLRAFSKDLGLSPAALSLILRDKLKVKKERAFELAFKLNLAENEWKEFFKDYSVEYQDGPPSAPKDEILIDDDGFNLISHWYHFALLALIKSPLKVRSLKDCALKLGISLQQVENALGRLERLKLIKREGREIKASPDIIFTGDQKTNRGLKFYMQSIHEMATKALEGTVLEKRSMSAISLVIDLKKLPLALEKIKEFRRELQTLLETDKSSEVYVLNINLFPVKRD